MSIMWGTDSKVEYLDPIFRFPVAIGASGEMRLQVADSRKLLIKLVGTEKILNQESIVKYFREILNMRVKTYIANYMGESQINIFDIDKYLEEFSQSLKEKLTADFGEYGVAIKKFIVSRIQKPEDRIFQRFKELQYDSYISVAEAQLQQKVDIINQETDAKRMILEAQGLAEKRRLEGYTYQDERSFEVAEKMAQNEAIGEFSNVGLGMGMMAGLGGGMGIKVADMATQALTGVVDVNGSENIHPSNTKRDMNTVADGTDIVLFEQRVQKLKIMKEAGLITDEELRKETEKLLQMI